MKFVVLRLWIWFILWLKIPITSYCVHLSPCALLVVLSSFAEIAKMGSRATVFEFSVAIIVRVKKKKKNCVACCYKFPYSLCFWRRNKCFCICLFYILSRWLSFSSVRNHWIRKHCSRKHHGNVIIRKKTTIVWQRQLYIVIDREKMIYLLYGQMNCFLARSVS